MDKSKMIELKPCPLCGGEPHAYCRWEGGDINLSGGKMWGVKCEVCGCDIYGLYLECDAIEMWNHRDAEWATQLRYCPFCGGQATVHKRWHPAGLSYRVVCRCCTCTMPPAPSEDDAARLWNDREGMGFEQKGRGNA